MEGGMIYWIFDSSRKVMPPNSALNPCILLAQFNFMDIRGGGFMGQVGAPWAEANEITTAQGNTLDYTWDSAKCLQYTVVRAELEWTSAPGGPVQNFWVTATSPALGHNGMAATSAAIKGEIDKQIQQQQDDSSKRSVPKL